MFNLIRSYTYHKLISVKLIINSQDINFLFKRIIASGGIFNK